jgi:hypothetical protein
MQVHSVRLPSLNEFAVGRVIVSAAGCALPRALAAIRGRQIMTGSADSV